MRRPLPRLLFLGSLFLVLASPASRAMARRGSPALHPAQAIGTRLRPVLERQLLVKLRRETRLDLALSALGMREERSLATNLQVDLVDSLQRFDGRLQLGTRRILRWEADLDGVPVDPPYTGVALTCRRRGDRFAAVPEEGWTLPMPDLVRLARQAPSVGLVPGFPEKIAVGAEATVDLSSLAGFLLDDQGEFTQARAELGLERFDGETRVASWKGKARFVENREVAGVAATLDYDLRCSIEENLAENRITALWLDGKIMLSGSGDVTLSGKGTLRVALRTQQGSALKRALRKKPAPRRNVWSLEEFGVTFQLPSLFARMADKDGKASFQHVREDAQGGNARLTLWMEPAEGTTPDEIFEAYGKTLAGQGVAFEEDRATAPLVQGHSYSYSKDVEGRRFLGEIDLYPSPPDILLVRFEAPPASFKTLRKDFLRMRRTLKALEGPSRR